VTPQVTDTPTVTREIAASETPLPPTATSGPLCTVLQALNLRNGPGTAYRPPLQSLPPHTELTPLGYNPVGIPGGTWVQVEDASQNQIGWVSAGGQFVTCNIDLTGLPSVAVAPPPPPPPPSLSNSTPDGNFPDNFVWEAIFSPQFFVRMKVYDNNSGSSKDGAGIKEVSFTVQDANGNTVYQRTEKNAGFCIFGGGEPDCNPWVIENYMYMWKSNGKPVNSGDYKLAIVVTADSGDQGNWNYSVTLKFPQ
jgi:hypothetical protein